jgi:hypothetical protein
MTTEYGSVSMTRACSRSIPWLLLALAGLAQAGDADRKPAGGSQDRFIGSWHLLTLEQDGADGTIHRADCTGMLVFTREGAMAVQVMYRSPKAGGEAAPVQYATGGYEASFGRYVIDDQSRTFSYHVDGALVRSLIGNNLKRAFELFGKQLIVKPANPNEHWKVIWEHD